MWGKVRFEGAVERSVRCEEVVRRVLFIVRRVDWIGSAWLEEVSIVLPEVDVLFPEERLPDEV